MFIAAVGDTPYRILSLLHILTAIVAFAPGFAHPILARQAKALDSDNQRAVMGFLSQNGQRIYAPALTITGLLGFAVSGMSDGVFKMSQGWLIASAVLWIAMNGALHGLVVPGERAMASGDMSAGAKVKAGSAAVNLMLVIMLYLMVFKPGL